MDDDTDLLTYDTYSEDGSWGFRVYDDEWILIKDSGLNFDSDSESASEARQWIARSGWIQGS